MQTATADPLVGRALENRYRILERIARGGMSVVYAAVDERLDRLVAVKVMSAALSADPAFTDRFAREARAAARLTHLNAVSVYDQGHERGPDGHHVFLVMELVQGRTLRELLRERTRLTPPEAVSIMEPVLSALSAAHRAGLVHRDIKPENILLSDDGVVKVADFGLARAVEADAASTRTGLMMGTVAYCPPEQIAHGTCDQRSDVYSAGIVLFELLTGEPPYRGESAMNIAYQHVHSRVPAPSSRVGGVPYEIDELVIAATDPDPAGRPADAGALLAEVAELRAVLSLPVTPVPPRVRPRGRPQHGSGAARAASPDSVTTAAVGARAGQHDTALDPVNGSFAATADPPVVLPPGAGASRASRAPRKRRRGLAWLLVLLLLAVGAAVGYASWYYAAGRYSSLPSVHGEPRAAAVHRLQTAGYHVHIQGSRFTDDVPAGRVLSTSPDGGSRVLHHARVSVVLSAGPRFYAVRSVRGDSLDQARTTLASVGHVQIAAAVRQEPDDTVANGMVTRTVPAGGAQVTDRQPITLYVSTGPPIIDVPDVAQGTPADKAKADLTRAHLKFVAQPQYSDSVTKGAVISCTPSDRARKFSTVSCTVSRGPEMVTVPGGLVDASVKDAEAKLTDAGLVPDVRVFGGDPGSDGTVIAVSPDSGTSVHTGQTVTVYAIPS